MTLEPIPPENPHDSTRMTRLVDQAEGTWYFLLST